MKRALFSSLILLFFVLIGCNGEGDEKVNFRVINAVPEISGIDIFVDDDLKFLDVPFSHSTSYIQINEGQKTFRVNEANRFTTLILRELFVDSNFDYSAVVFGTPTEPRLLFLRDNNEPPEGGRVKLRFIHSSLIAGRVDLYVGEPNFEISELTPTLEDFTFDSTSIYLQGIPGRYLIRATLANKSTVIVESKVFSFKKGQIRTIILTDSPTGQEPLEFSLVADRG